MHSTLLDEKQKFLSVAFLALIAPTSSIDLVEVKALGELTLVGVLVPDFS